MSESILPFGSRHRAAKVYRDWAKPEEERAKVWDELNCCVVGLGT
jgi:hypothetical protein